jgi:RNA polymerase sigma-70 factor, ECF subfamily
METEKSVLPEHAEALARIRRGDLDAFACLVQHFQGPIVNFLYRLTGDSEVARDLAQDTFVQAYKKLITSCPTLSFKSWLYRIATNNALQYLRRKARIAFVPLDESRKTTTAEDAAQKGAAAAAVQEALLRVPERMRVCMVLHFVDGFKHREIANMLGISEDAVRMRVARGSEEFRRAYRASGGVL